MSLLAVDKTALMSPELLIPGRQPTGHVRPSVLAQQVCREHGGLIVPFSAQSRMADIVSGRQPISYSYAGSGPIGVLGNIRGYYPKPITPFGTAVMASWYSPPNLSPGFSAIIHYRSATNDVGGLSFACGTGGAQGCAGVVTNIGTTVAGFSLITYYGVADYNITAPAGDSVRHYSQTCVMVGVNSLIKIYRSGRLINTVSAGVYRKWLSTNTVALNTSIDNRYSAIGMFALFGGPISDTLAKQLSANPYLLVDAA